MPTPTPGTMILSRSFTTQRGEIPYWEFKNSYGEVFQDDGVSLTNCLGCYWKDREAFRLALLGFPYITGTAGSSGAKLRRYLPEKHPDFTVGTDNEGKSPMYAWDMQFLDGLGWEGRNSVSSALAYHDSQPTYDPSTGTFSRPANEQGLALYMVTFRPRIYNVTDDDTADANSLLEQSRFTSLTQEPGGENYAVGQGLLYDDGSPDISHNYVGDALGTQLFPQSILNFTWHELPVKADLTSVVPPQTTYGYWNGATLVQGMMGSVNATTFLGKPAGTLLGLAPTIRRYQSRTTDILEDWTFHFEYRPQGHNRYLLPVVGTWTNLVRAYDHTKGAILSFEFKDVFDVSKA